jgi:hypothetical protein
MEETGAADDRARVHSASSPKRQPRRELHPGTLTSPVPALVGVSAGSGSQLSPGDADEFSVGFSVRGLSVFVSRFAWPFLRRGLIRRIGRFCFWLLR